MNVDDAKQGGVPPTDPDAPGSVLSMKKGSSQPSKQKVYEVPGDHTVYGTFVRKCKTTTRPIDILPDFWMTLNVKRRQEIIAEFPARQAKRLAEQDDEMARGNPAVPAQPEGFFFPRMSVTHERVQEHRENLQESSFPFNAAVARTVNKRELGRRRFRLSGTSSG